MVQTYIQSKRQANSMDAQLVNSAWLLTTALLLGVIMLLRAAYSAIKLAQAAPNHQYGWWAVTAAIVAFIGIFAVFLAGNAPIDSLANSTSIIAGILLVGTTLVTAILWQAQRSVQFSVGVASSASHESLHDHLTGLPNRRWFLGDLKKLINNEQRFALLMIDLNKFKQINDALGHTHGDETLKQVAARLNTGLKSTQRVYRLGGDEFALLEQEPDKAENTAQQLLDYMREPIDLDELIVDIGASVGIASHPEHGTEVTALLSRADMAMYEAKRKSMGWAWFQDDLDTQMRRKLTISTNLRRAVADNQLILHYQPICSNDGMSIKSVEALVRWPVRDGEFISPQEFIPIAEEERMVDAITNWVVRTAVQQLGAWLREGLDIKMNINLSALDLQDPNLWSRISEILKTENVPPNRIVLELTESAMMQDVERASKTVREISNGGALVAIDDFGTGYSSMARLKNMAIDQIKIDRFFVRDVVDNPQDTAIVNATVFLAKNLGCTVTAEGVETGMAARHLRSLGCDHLQGFHFARPQSAQDISYLLRHFPVPVELRQAS